MKLLQDKRVVRGIGIGGLVILFLAVTWAERRVRQPASPPVPAAPAAEVQHQAHHHEAQTLTADNLAALEPSGTVENGVRQAPYEAFCYGFDPDPLVVLAGERVRLRAKSRDVRHGATIPALDLSLDMPVGDAKTVEFTAPGAPGRYPVYCSVFCGSGHGDMHGSIVVLPREQAHRHE